MEQTVNIFKALSDETRLRILSLLLTEGELCVCDIISTLKQPQSTISRHLAYLRKTGMVSDRRCGIWMYYSIFDGNTLLQQELLELLKKHLSTLPTTLNDRERMDAINKNSCCA